VTAKRPLGPAHRLHMLRGRRPPSQGWKTILRNQTDGIAAVDFLVVPILTFERLFAFIVLDIGRRCILWIGVTANPTAEWLARQITEAFPWGTAPQYLIRDNDGAYGEIFMRRLRSMGIRDRPITPRSPWQNGYVERVIGSIRRECLDHVIVWSEAHLRRVLRAYAAYHNSTRTHPGLHKDAPNHRRIERHVTIVSRDIPGDLHHQYCRIRLSERTGGERAPIVPPFSYWAYSVGPFGIPICLPSQFGKIAWYSQYEFPRRLALTALDGDGQESFVK
jgi:transposase InsO family protein